MSQILFSGLDGSKLVHNNQSDNSGTLAVIDQFTLILCENVTDIEIGWDYFIIWKNLDAYISGKYSTDDCDKFSRLLQIPQHENRKVKQAIAGADNITVLTDAHDIWTYKIYSDSWKKVPSFISAVKKGKKEYVVKIAQGRCTVALTNLGHVFNIPIHLNNSDSVQFVDIACGYDHTILLTGNGNVYSTGMGTRGQLGHGDLEDCDEPKLIEALAGLKVIQISAGGWHSAIVTDQGDIYSWGWNYSGQLGLSKIQKVIAVPTVVDFKNETDEIIELNVIKVQCGTSFTVLRIDTGDFLGCGSNKYGQLGLPREDFSNLKQFVQLNIRGFAKPIKDFKCQEWELYSFLVKCIYSNDSIASETGEILACISLELVLLINKLACKLSGVLPSLGTEGRSKECSVFEAKSSKVYQFADIYINGPLLALRSRSFRLDRNPVT